MRPLTALVDWRKALAAIGVSATGCTLPLWLRCPVCQTRRMQIFQHHATGGQWHYCPCGAQGDMVRLIQSVHHCSLEEALRLWLSRGGQLPSGASTERLLQQHAVQQQTTAALDKTWESATELHLAAGQRALHGLGARANRLVGWNAEGVDRVVRAASTEKLQQQLTGCSTSRGKPPADGLVLQLPKARRLLPKDCLSAVVVPFYDLPGRISSLWLSGGEDYSVQIAADLVPNEHLARAEAGLAFHPQLLTHREPILLLSHVVQYLRLSCRQLELQPEPLPLAAWIDRPGLATQDWQLVSGRRLVFHARQLTADLLAKVITADGELYVEPARETGPQDRFFIRQQPWEVYEDCLQRALPWPRALARYFARRSEQSLRAFLEQLYLHSQLDLSAVLSRCERSFRQRAEQLLEHIRPYRTVFCESRLVEERPEGYYLRGAQEEQLCNATLKLDQLVWYERLEQSYYEGRVQFGGQEYLFSERREVLEKNLTGWLQDFLLRRQAGVLQFNTSWARRLLGVARQFSQPPLVTGHDQAGWCEHGWVTPTYGLSRTGEVTPLHYLARPGSPRELPAPGSVAPSVLELALTRTDAGSYGFWTAYLALVADVLGPALNLPRSSVGALGGASWQVLQQAAAACGCGQLSGSEPELALQFWPTLISPGPATTPLRGIASELSPLAGVAYGLTADWTLLTLPLDAEFEPGLSESLRGLLPTFLQHLTRQGLAALRTSESLTARLRSRLSEWISQTYGFPARALYQYPHQSLHAWEPQHSAGRLLVRGLWQLLDEEQLVLRPYEAGKLRNSLWEGRVLVYVPKQLLYEALRQHAPALSLSKLTQAWLEAKALREHRVVHGVDCWALDKTWLLTELHRLQPASQPALLQIAEGT